MPVIGITEHQIKMCIRDSLFVKHQWQVSVVTTQAKGEATQLASDAALHYDLLVCSGGDGTLNEVVSGLVKDERHIPIGYLPAGTTNDFAVSYTHLRSSSESPTIFIHFATAALVFCLSRLFQRLGT